MLTEEQAKQLLNMLVSVDKEQQILAATILCNELDIYINTTYEYNPNTGKFTPKNRILVDNVYKMDFYYWKSEFIAGVRTALKNKFGMELVYSCYEHRFKFY